MRSQPAPGIHSCSRWIVLVALLALPLAFPLAGAAQEPGGDEAPESPRTKVRVELDCGNELSRQVITVFGNGTLRVLDGPRDALRSRVRELSPEALDALFAQLEREILNDAESDVHDLSGPWAEQCRFALDLPGRTAESFEFSRYSRLALGLAQSVRIVEDLKVWVEPVGDDEGQLDPDYQPRVGDVLQHLDGERYIVVSLTTEGHGVELEGVDVPLVLYVARDALGDTFTALVERRPR